MSGNETVSGSEDVSVPVIGAVPRTRRLRGILTAVLGTVLVLGTAGGGIGYTYATARGAEHETETVAWSGDTPEADNDKWKHLLRGRQDNPLSKQLLPVHEAYRLLGPDHGEFGNDGVLDGKEATELLAESLPGLSGTQRREYRRAVEDMRLRGFAIRTYDTAWPDSHVVEIQLMRLADAKAVTERQKSWSAFFGALGELGFEKGPSIPDHKDAECYLMPQDEESDFDGMICSAAEGDVLVGFQAEAPVPFNDDAMAKMFEEQLNKMTPTGESV